MTVPVTQRPFSWTCPFCNHAQVVTDENYWINRDHIDRNTDKAGNVGVRSEAIICANPECQQLNLTVDLVRDIRSSATGGWTSSPGSPLASFDFLPRGAAKPQPDYIPKAILDDYVEACLIRTLSPKASATLSRRCLQGMIRDFCGISKKRLIDEIRELRRQVDEGEADRNISIESVGAIDAVREVGNIGAHMEADVDHIIEVDPGEAELLIGLIEDLFADWYVQREKRRSRFQALADLAAEKKTQKQQAGSNQALPTSPIGANAAEAASDQSA